MGFYTAQGEYIEDNVEHFSQCKGFWSKCSKECGGGTQRWTTTYGNCGDYKIRNCNLHSCPSSKTPAPAPRAPAPAPAPSPRAPATTPARAPATTPATNIKYYDTPSNCRCCKYNRTGLHHTLSCGCCNSKEKDCKKSCNSSCGCKSSDYTLLTLNNCNNGVKNDNGVLKCN